MDDIDSQRGLHGYMCCMELRNQRNSAWSQIFRDVYCKLDYVKENKGTYSGMGMQWWIQDFPDGGANPWVRDENLLFDKIFSEKWIPRPPDPSMVCVLNLFLLLVSIEMLCSNTLIGGSWSYLIGLKAVFCLKFWEFIACNAQKIIFCGLRFNPHKVSLNSPCKKSLRANPRKFKLTRGEINEPPKWNASLLDFCHLFVPSVPVAMLRMGGFNIFLECRPNS